MRTPCLLLLLPAALVLLAAPAPAQQLPVKLTGLVEKVGANPCNPKATHRVECSSVLLVGGKADLKPWEGQYADLKGTFAVDPQGCVTVTVDEAAKAAVKTTTFALFGYRRGATVTVTTTAPTGAVVATFFGLKPGFLPLGDYGAYLLDPLNSFPYYFTPSVVVALQLWKIPDDPALAGLDILFQTAWLQVTPGIDGGFLNPSCFRIE